MGRPEMRRKISSSGRPLTKSGFDRFRVMGGLLHQTLRYGKRRIGELAKHPGCSRAAGVLAERATLSSVRWRSAVDDNLRLNRISDEALLVREVVQPLFVSRRRQL